MLKLTYITLSDKEVLASGNQEWITKLKTELIKSVKNNDLVRTKELLDSGVDVNIDVKDDHTLLNLACQSTKDTEMVSLILKYNPDINKKFSDYFKSTVLMEVCDNLDKNPILKLEFIKLLVENGADVNMTAYNMTSLMELTREVKNKEGIEAIKYLLDHGADPKILTRGCSKDALEILLEYSIRSNKEELNIKKEAIMLLLDHGVIVEERHKSRNKLLIEECLKLHEEKSKPKEKSTIYVYGFVSPIKLTVIYPDIIEHIDNNRYYYGYLLEKQNNRIKLPTVVQIIIIENLSKYHLLDNTDIYQL